MEVPSVLECLNPCPRCACPWILTWGGADHLQCQECGFEVTTVCTGFAWEIWNRTKPTYRKEVERLISSPVG